MFEDCKSYTYDEYWREVFVNCAHNKFPRGVSFNARKNTLFVRQSHGRGGETIPLPRETPAVFTTMMTIFRTTLGMQSPTDQLQTKRDLEKSSIAVNMDSEWKQIPRYLQDELLAQFVVKLAASRGFSAKEKQTFYSFVELHIQLKNILPGDVVYANREIQSIRDLKFDKATRCYTVRLADRESITAAKSSADAKKDRFIKIVDHYIKGINATAFE